MKKTLQLSIILLENAWRYNNEKDKNNIMRIINHHTVIQPNGMH